MIGQEVEYVVEVNENIAFIGLHVSPAHAYYKNQLKIALNS
jgi:hypothetical protein